MEIFGSQMTSSFGDTPPKLWNIAIERLSDQEIQRGLAKVGSDGRKFPPNLSEFMDACRRIPEQPHRGIPIDPRTLLESGPKRQFNFNELRQALRSEQPAE